MEQEVKDKAPKPKGLMPKNHQALVIAGIAILMVIIMALTGRKRPKMPAQDPAPGTAAAATSPPVDQAKVAALRQDIQQQQVASAPQVEAALLQQQRMLAAQRELAGDPQNPYGTPVTGTVPNGAYPPGAYAAGSQPAAAPPPDPIKEDQKKRRYESLFADNVALTYRKEGMQSARADMPRGAAPISGPLSPGASNPTAFEAREQQLLDQEAAQIAQEQRMLEQAPAASAAPPTQLPPVATPSGGAGKTSPPRSQRETGDPPGEMGAEIGAVLRGMSALADCIPSLR